MTESAVSAPGFVQLSSSRAEIVLDNLVAPLVLPSRRCLVGCTVSAWATEGGY
jgi:hypothetical protein